ncbi:MAG: hypothetical protein V4456_07640 [Bacteroidota bacterium]
MGFEIDKQTLNDLEIFTSESGDTIYSFFNACTTVGGRKKLESMMRNPSNDLLLLTERKKIIEFFVVSKLSIPLKNYELEIVEEYLKLNTDHITPNFSSVLKLEIKRSFGTDQDVYKIESGIGHLASLLTSIKRNISTLESAGCPEFISSFISDFDALTTSALQGVMVLEPAKKISTNNIARFDQKIRKGAHQNILNLIQTLYEIDAYQSIANAALKHSLCFPEYLREREGSAEITGLYHPGISQPVGNDITIDANSNVFFMTGANMSGKSSFLKALGLAIYLAHIGFPVPAKSMHTRVFNGLITMLNLADNINLGYSHFYSEVMRVKESAIKLVEQKNMFVIYDELFRGTNNKDAYDASLLIIPLFTKIKHSVFFVSSHVLELGDELRKFSNITFKCFHSRFAEDSLLFDYKLYDGISTDHIGMYIVEKACIVEIIEQEKKPSVKT